MSRHRPKERRGEGTRATGSLCKSKYADLAHLFWLGANTEDLFTRLAVFCIFALVLTCAEPAGSGYRQSISFIDCAAQRVQSAKRHLVREFKE